MYLLRQASFVSDFLWVSQVLKSFFMTINSFYNFKFRQQPFRDVLKKRCYENMQQIYKRTPMPKCVSTKLQSNFIEIILRHGCSPVNLLHVFRTTFPKNTSEGLLLKFQVFRRLWIISVDHGWTKFFLWVLRNV